MKNPLLSSGGVVISVGRIQKSPFIYPSIGLAA
jgi:hypothetical protein